MGAPCVQKLRTSLNRFIIIKLDIESCYCCNTVMVLSFRTDRSRQTVQIQIRLLLEEQSDQGLHCFAVSFASFGGRNAKV